VASKWWREEKTLTLEVNIPVNSVGEVYIPTINIKNPVIKEGEEIVWKDGELTQRVPGLISARKEGDYIIFNVGSGKYIFWVGEKTD
jgi:hypothetical protein